MPPRPITKVVVAGGGIVGWSAAAALKAQLPALDVTVLALDPPADSLADRLGSTLPSTLEFHDRIALKADAVIRAGSGFRLGSRFEGWAGGPDYVHAYGGHGASVCGSPFHQQWVRAANAGAAAPFDAYSLASAMGKARRFAPPPSDGRVALADFAYGLQIDLNGYREAVRSHALKLGAAERKANAIAGVEVTDSGLVSRIAFPDGGEASADLFIDATGPGKLIRGALDDEFEDWGRWLPSDSILFAEAEPSADLPSLDRIIAMPAGWRWVAASPSRTLHGFVYSSRHMDDEAARTSFGAAANLGPTEAPVRIRQGRLKQPWLRNCVAIGDSAVAIEPLEWANLHLAHRAIERIVALIPDCDFADVEVWDYNRQAEAEANRVRDFVLLHYATARRDDSDFWKAASAQDLPASLRHSLTQFRERGRLPFHEQESFSRDSWLAVLLGQGELPRRVDPLAQSVPIEEAQAEMERLRKAIERLAGKVPMHSETVAVLQRQAGR